MEEVSCRGGRFYDASDNGPAGRDCYDPQDHRQDEVRQHLAGLGFVVNSDVTVVSQLAGNLILQVKDSRVALDKTMANRIMI